MNSGISSHYEPNSTSTLLVEPGVLVVKTTPYPGALESLVERAAPSWPCFERHLDLLGLADLSTQARPEYGKLRRGGGYRNLDLCPCPWSTPLRQSARLDLQPHESRARHVSAGSASALAVCLPVHAERHGVRSRAGHGRRLALLAASPRRSVGRSQDAPILPWRSLR